MSMENNKSPGIDGIPVEFYQTYWDIIKPEFHGMIIHSLSGLKLSETYLKVIIIILEKGEDPTLVSSWRPISLRCVDTKVISKLISSRLRLVIGKCISNSQFCTLPRHIVECNNITRDTIYYTNYNNIQGAIINVDWCKAFDRIGHELLFIILLKMGFSNTFIKSIKNSL